MVWGLEHSSNDYLSSKCGIRGEPLEMLVRCIFLSQISLHPVLQSPVWLHITTSWQLSTGQVCYAVNVHKGSAEEM